MNCLDGDEDKNRLSCEMVRFNELFSEKDSEWKSRVDCCVEDMVEVKVVR